MKKVSLFIAAVFGSTIAFGAEGDVGTQAYVWGSPTAYKALDSITYPNGLSLSAFQGKVILMNVFQYNCLGCDANAPTIGRLADSLGSGMPNSRFQAVGAEINNGTFAQIQTSYNSRLRMNAANVNYPLVHVPFDTAINSDGVGTRWHRYNSYRDVYFVIDHTGKIVARIAGNRSNAMHADSLAKLKAALSLAIAAAPTSILCLNSCGKDGFKASKRDGGFHFSLNSVAGPVKVQILDLQGRNMQTFSISPSMSEAVWNGKDTHGNAIPYGTYFMRATGSGISSSQRITWQP